MKTTKFLLAIATVAAIFVSCADDDTANVTINNNGGGGSTIGSNALVIGGTLTDDLTLVRGTEYILDRALFVQDGITLTIEPGVVVSALPGSDVFVAVEQGGVINAEGTATDPIVFTSATASPEAGDWGGLIILGRAPINSVAGGDAISTSEIAGLPYGGTIQDDNSGILRYVRVEYSGGAANAAAENNGFSFYAVGNGTTIEFIQAFQGADDGVEFFGGNVDVSYVSVVGAEDDSVDWTEGYTGSITNVYIEHRGSHDRGIEADGFNTDIGNLSDPVFWSAPTVTNVTVVGSDDSQQAILLRAGTRATITNVLLEDFEQGVNFGDAETGVGVLAGETSVTDITFNNIIMNFNNATGAAFDEADVISGIGNGIGAEYDTWNAGWTQE